MSSGCGKERLLGREPEHGSDESLRLTLRGMLGTGVVARDRLPMDTT